MISALSAYKAMIEASANQPSAKRESGAASKIESLSALSKVAGKLSGDSAVDSDIVNLSASKDVFTAVESFFDLGKPNRFEDFHNLSREDKESFVKIVAELARSGYMGYEELVVDNKVERHEIAHQMGDDRIRGARVYDENKDRFR